ncbi:MAG: 2-C-methyl-D-erythritol 2,4-cyclodiphosphate synthase [Defluviitaleaceae bacterium]|nr:2-C-methyl-D-erythritol 2,4-cyclodiphosphate synthase [Defluviitaleaceae bacterium]
MVNFRVGHGYDVHRLASGRKLVLGGVEISFEKGLDGHSDADVLTHAIMDALLGAAGLGDIGQSFPDTDVLYKNAYSIELLRKVAVRLKENGWRVGNIDATIIAQAPKLAPYRAQMVENIANALEIPPSVVNIKATTEEGLGFTGRGEGMAAHAVCLIGGSS